MRPRVKIKVTRGLLQSIGMKTKEQLLEVFESTAKLSASPRSDSPFPVIRELTLKLFKELRPIILEIGDSEDTGDKLEAALTRLSQSGQPLHEVYLFARDLTGRRLARVETLTYKDWAANRFFIQKAWFDSFSDRVADLVVGFKKNLSKYNPLKVARYLKGSINTLVSHAFAGGVLDELTHDGTDAPEDILVIRIPLPGACSECLRVFTEGGEPRVFKLSELLANGEDPLRKPGERLPCLGPLHPNCRCLLAAVGPHSDLHSISKRLARGEGIADILETL